MYAVKSIPLGCPLSSRSDLIPQSPIGGHHGSDKDKRTGGTNTTQEKRQIVTIARNLFLGSKRFASGEGHCQRDVTHQNTPGIRNAPNEVAVAIALIDGTSPKPQRKKMAGAIEKSSFQVERGFRIAISDVMMGTIPAKPILKGKNTGPHHHGVTPASAMTTIPNRTPASTTHQLMNLHSF